MSSWACVFLLAIVMALAVADFETVQANDGFASLACSAGFEEQASDGSKTVGALLELCQRVLRARPGNSMVTVSSPEAAQKLKSQINKVISGDALTAVSPSVCSMSDINSVPTTIDGTELGNFLKVLSTLSDAIRPTEVALSSFRVMGSFSVPVGVLTLSIRFEHVIFCGHVNFRGVEFKKHVGIQKALILSAPNGSLEGIFNATRATFGSDVLIEDSRIGAVVIPRASVAGVLSVSGSQLGFFTMRESRAERFTTLKTVQSKAIFKRAKRALAAGDDDALYPFPNAILDSYFDMLDTRIEGEVYGDELRTDGPIASQSARFRNLRFRRADIFAADFRGIVVEQDIDLAGATIGRVGGTRVVECDFQKSWHQSIDYVSFRGARVGRNILFVDDERNNGEKPIPSTSFRMVCLNEMEVGGRVDLRGFTGSRLDLGRSEVGKGVILANEERSIWQPEDNVAELRLEQSVLGGLYLANITPFPEQTWLSGAVISRIGMTVFDDKGSRRGALAVEAAEHISGFLNRMPAHLAQRESYRTFQNAFREAGEWEAVVTLRLAEEKRVTEDAEGLRWLARKVAYMLGGHGLAPEHTALFALIVVVVGTCVFRFSKAGKSFLYPKDPAGWNARRRVGVTAWKFFDAVIFSIDRLIPIVEINKLHREVVFESERWVRTYFVVHAVLGWLLAAAVLGVAAESLGLQ